MYELEEYQPDYGGLIVFTTAPVSGDTIFIFRKTPITQQLDYVDGQPFPTDAHEFQLDKDTRILQEIGIGGFGGGAINLATIQNPTNVIITNDSGTDATINLWTIDGLLAGVASGEVVDVGGIVPVDASPTTKQNGYIWWVLEALP